MLARDCTIASRRGVAPTYDSASAFMLNKLPLQIYSTEMTFTITLI